MGCEFIERESGAREREVDVLVAAFFVFSRADVVNVSEGRVGSVVPILE